MNRLRHIVPIALARKRVLPGARDWLPEFQSFCDARSKVGSCFWVPHSLLWEMALVKAWSQIFGLVFMLALQSWW